MSMFNVFKHLLPTGRAWSITQQKQLRSFFESISESGDDVKDYADNIFNDLFPYKTRFLDLWESHFALRNSIIDEDTRRLRLDASFKALGGQDPHYIQNLLQSSGFNVFVHEWWEPGTEPLPGVKGSPTARNPFLVVKDTNDGLTGGINAGEALAQAGEADILCGNSNEPRGYLLVNKINKVYNIPNDPLKWPYILYIGGETFGDTASVLPSRKDEFEELLLKVCPCHLWLAVLVEYN